MTQEQFVENLDIQKKFVNIIAPGGPGQVDNIIFLFLFKLRYINVMI